MARVEVGPTGSTAKASGDEGSVRTEGRASVGRSFRAGRITASLEGMSIPEAEAFGHSPRPVEGVPTLRRQKRTGLHKVVDSGRGPIVGPRDVVAILPTLLPTARGVALGGDEWFNTLVTRPNVRDIFRIMESARWLAKPSRR